MAGSLIMVAKGRSNQDGQSVLEFLMMFPMLIGITIILMRINTAIQMSIVDQQYARAQALFLTYNNAYYPELRFHSRLINVSASNQMVLGVSDNASDSQEQEYLPKASEQNIARNAHVNASNAPHEEPPLRANVRVRNSVTLCTPTLFIAGKGGASVPLLPLGTTRPFKPIGSVALGESSKISQFCGSKLPYEQ